MEQLKYFTPSIEDIRVGYECERKTCKQDICEWEPYIFTDKYIATIIYKYALDKSFRVPYLTKEQIEAEGWEYNHLGFAYKNGFTLLKEEGYPIIIGKDNQTYYKGECKDINTFRYITKLLKIK